MQTDRSAVACYQFCKIYNFLFCTLAGVRRSVKINGFDLDTTFCDHVAGNRAVDTAGKKEHCLAVCSDRHSSRSWKSLGIYIDLVTDLYGQCHFRMMYIYRCLRECIQDLFSDSCADFHGSDRVGFLGSSCVDFEASGISRVSCFHIRYDIFCHLVKSLIFVDHDRADTYDTKYSLQSLHSLVKIIFLRTEHVYTALFLGYCKFAFYRLQSQFHLLYKGIFKKISVFSLDGDLCIFDQKCMKYHTVPPDYFLEYRLSIGTRVFMVSRK